MQIFEICKTHTRSRKVFHDFCTNLGMASQANLKVKTNDADRLVSDQGQGQDQDQDLDDFDLLVSDQEQDQGRANVDLLVSDQIKIEINLPNMAKICENVTPLFWRGENFEFAVGVSEKNEVHLENASQ